MSEARQTEAVRRLFDLAKRDLRRAMSLVDMADSAAVADVLHTYVPIIAERYGLAAGALAADWYDDMRAAGEVRGSFRAEPADLPDAGRYESLVRWALTQTEIELLVAGGLQRIIANMHRETVMGASLADPQAAGWARFSGGSDGSCPFCYMLISRGDVYSSKTAKFGAHDNCNCQAGPVWKGLAGARRADAYRKSTRRREDADGNMVGSSRADADRARDWIASNL